MKQTIEEWRRSILASSRRPAFPVLTSLGFDLIGRNILDGARSGAIQAQAIAALAESYAFAASPMMMDLSVESEAFGAPVRFAENEIPTVLAPCIGPDRSVAGLREPSLDSGRVPEYLEAARIAAERIPDRPIFAGSIGPLSLAGRLFGMAEIMVEMVLDPDTISRLLETCTAFLVRYAQAYKATGVHGVLVAEPAAGMLSPELCDLFSSAYVKRIVDAVQDERFLVILHNCGNTGVLNRSMLATGARALHFGNRNPIAATLAELPADVLVMGNLDPANVFRLGSPDRVREETRSLLAAAGKHANFVISSGCDIPPGTPRANIDAFYGAVREYNGQKASPPEFRRGRDTVPHVVPVFGMRGRHKGAIAIDRREPKD